MAAGKFGARRGGDGDGDPPSRRAGGREVESQLISRLRQLPERPAPDPRFKSELRSQLVSIAPRIVAEAAAQTGHTLHRERAPARGLSRLRRPLLALTGAAAVLVLLLGLAVDLAGHALPGQSLYGLKRASEDFRLSVNGGSDADKGRQYLRLATNRASESGRLAGSGPASTSTAGLIAGTLRTADSETRTGMQLLGRAALATDSLNPVTPVTAWAETQRAAILALLPKLPAGSAGLSQAKSSLDLLKQVTNRVDEWKQDFKRGCLTTANADELGPKGC